MDDFARLKTVFQRLRHFAELPDEVQRAIIASASHRHFEAERTIYVEGEPAEAIYVLESGWVKAARMTHEGRETKM